MSEVGFSRWGSEVLLGCDYKKIDPQVGPLEMWYNYLKALSTLHYTNIMHLTSVI